MQSIIRQSAICCCPGMRRTMSVALYADLRFMLSSVAVVFLSLSGFLRCFKQRAKWLSAFFIFKKILGGHTHENLP